MLFNVFTRFKDGVKTALCMAGWARVVFYEVARPPSENGKISLLFREWKRESVLQNFR